jgi:hypothetical protein
MTRPAKCRLLALVLALALMGLPGSAHDQPREVEQVRLYGRVQWVTSSKMVIWTDCGFLEKGCTPISVAIDLTRVPLHEYRGVRAGSWVVVEAVVGHRNSHHSVFARSVMLVEEPEAP